MQLSATWFVKTHFASALSSIEAENGSETGFQTPELGDANAPVTALSPLPLQHRIRAAELAAI